MGSRIVKSQIWRNQQKKMAPLRSTVYCHNQGLLPFHCYIYKPLSGEEPYSNKWKQQVYTVAACKNMKNGILPKLSAWMYMQKERTCSISFLQCIWSYGVMTIMKQMPATYIVLTYLTQLDRPLVIWKIYTSAIGRLTLPGRFSLSFSLTERSMFINRVHPTSLLYKSTFPYLSINIPSTINFYIMARLSCILFIILFAFAFHFPISLDARNNILRLSMTEVPSLEDRTAVLSRPGLPSSSGEKVDAMAIQESLIFSHLAKMDRILQQSVPSPGAGH